MLSTLLRGPVPFILLVACTADVRAHEATLTGDTWQARPFLTREGFPFPEVRDLAEGHDGAIWIGTWGAGVTRVRRTEWRTFDESNGLPSNWVRSVEVTADGSVWVGTANGLVRIRGDVLEVFDQTTVPDFPSHAIRTLEAFPDGSLWVSFAETHGVLRYDPDAAGGERWTRALAQDPEGELVPLVAARDGTAWGSYRRHGGIRRFGGSDGGGAGGDEHVGAPPGTVHAIFQDQSERFWSSVAGSLVAWRDGEELLTVASPPLFVTCLAESEAGTLWAGTAGGVYRREKGEDWRRLELHDTVYVRRLLFSRDGRSLWVGTRTGLLRGAKQEWRRFTHTRDGVPLRAASLCPDGYAFPLCVDFDGSLARFDGQSWVPFARVAADDFRPHHSTVDGQGVLWALSDAEVVLVSLPDGDVLRRVPVPAGILQPDGVSWHPESRLLSLARGDVLLVAEGGVFALDGSRWVDRRPSLQTAQPRTVGAAAEGIDGSLYVCYRNDHYGTGFVERWSGAASRRLQGLPPHLEGKQFEAITCSPDGALWLGTHGQGLIRHDGRAISQLTTADGAAANILSELHAARDGTLWVAYHRMGLGSYRDGLWIHYGELQRGPARQITRVGEDAAGRIWAAVPNAWFDQQSGGVFLYVPETAAPDTALEAHPTGEVASGGIAAFSFTAVDSWSETDASRLAFSWRFVPEGVPSAEAPWSPFRRARWLTTADAPLAPGQYRFEVRAADRHRNVDPTPAFVEFSVARPLWMRSGVMVPLALLGMVALVSLVLGYRKHLSLRRSERELRRTSRERERAVIESERLREQLHQSQKLEAIGTLAAGVAHDFNNIMTVVLGYTDLLQAREEDPSSKRFLAEIRRASDQARAVTRALLTFARRAGGETAQQDLTALVREAISLLCHMLPASIELVARLPEEEVWIDADATRIHQVVLNLAVNARDAMPDGGRLEIVVRSTGRSASLVVRDTGAGIPESSRKQVFEPFFSTKPRSSGTGLGLSIVHGIVTGHGGSIEIDSSPGRGTRVSIVFPCTAPGPRAAPAAAAQRPAAGRGELILLVDDNEQVRRVLAKFLRDAGYRVLTAGTGPSALELFAGRSAEIAVVVMDLDLPLRDGLSCLEAMREVTPDLRAIVITGLADDRVLAFEGRPGVTLLRKPFARARFLEAVGRHLGVAP